MQPFIIPLNGLSAGESRFRWEAGGEFFASFENPEILDARITADVVVLKYGKYIGVDCHIEGDVTVECDRCLADLVLPVDVTFRQSIKFGEAGSGGSEVSEGGREIVFLPEDDTDLDMSQVIYDYTCISLPMQRVHTEGGCDPETVKYLSEEGDEEEQTESPFASLKGLIDNNLK